MNKLGAIKMFDSPEAAVAAGFPIQLTQEEADKLLAIPMEDRVDAHRLMVDGVPWDVDHDYAPRHAPPKTSRRRFKTRAKVHRNG